MYNKTFLPFLFTLVSALWALPTTAQQLPAAPGLVTGQLENGLEYYIFPHDYPEQTAVIRLYLKAGSMLEREDQQGLAHFVEHMAFNGTEHYPKNELIDYLGSMGVEFGADINAHTSFDETVYKLQVPLTDETMLDQALLVFRDWAGGITFAPEEIDGERGVILSEWRTRLGAVSRLRDQYFKLFFNDGRYAHRLPIGLPEVLEDFEHTALTDYYHDWYRPELMGLAVVGDVDAEQTEQLIKKHFAGLENPADAPEAKLFPAPDHADTLVGVFTDDEASDLTFYMANRLSRADPVQTVAQYRSELVDDMLNLLLEYRLERLMDSTSYVSGVRAYVGSMTEAHEMLFAYAGLFDDRLKEGVQFVARERERLFRHGFTAFEFEQQKKRLLRDLDQNVKQFHRTTSVRLIGQLKDLYMKEVQFMTPQQHQELSEELLADLSVEDINARLMVLKKAGNPSLFVAGKPLEQLPGEAALLNWVTEAETQPHLPQVEVNEEVRESLMAAAPTPGSVVETSQLSGLESTQWTLSNGLKVVYKRVPGMKRVLINGSRPGGHHAATNEDYLATVLNSDLLGEMGVADLNRNQLKDFLAGKTAYARLSLMGERDAAVAVGSPEDIVVALQWLHLLFTQPRFDQEVFELEKQKMVASYEAYQPAPADEFRKKLRSLYNDPEKPSFPPQADEVEAALSFDYLKQLHQQRFTSADGMEFFVTADLEPAAVQDLVTTYIATLPTGQVDLPVVQPAYVLGEQRQLEMKGYQEYRADVHFVYLGELRQVTYRDQVVQALAEKVLSAKLRKQLREASAGVYGVGVRTEMTNLPEPHFQNQILFTCRPDERESLVAQMKGEMERIAADPEYFTEELVASKAQLVEARRNAEDRDGYWLGKLIAHHMEGMTDTLFFTDFDGMVQAVTAAEVSACIKRQFVEAELLEGKLLPAEGVGVE